MPWCESCDRFYNPNTLQRDGRCPACGRQVADPASAAEAAVRAPWHFWALLAAVVAYLGWRLVQGVAWLLGTS